MPILGLVLKKARGLPHLAFFVPKATLKRDNRPDFVFSFHEGLGNRTQDSGRGGTGVRIVITGAILISHHRPEESYRQLALPGNK